MYKEKLEYVVWELTNGCNMRCKHCGSSCTIPKQDELSLEECLNICDMLSEMKVGFVTLTGGEPLTKKGWFDIAKKLTDNGIMTMIISNGWCLNDEIINKIVDANISAYAISIDGIEETHDDIRRKGSFQHDLLMIKALIDKNVKVVVATTLNNINCKELDKMYDIFENAGVKYWQFQVALPMGNLRKQKKYSFTPDLYEDIIDFAYKKKKGSIEIIFTDGFGYFDPRQIEMLGDECWAGCSAGKKSIGILQNGDVVGCTSIRSTNIIEGNLTKTSLREIWESDYSFAWNRNFEKSNLKGFCRDCQYADICLGGCSNSRYTLHGSINSENDYCSYNYLVKQIWKDLKELKEDDLEKLYSYYLECGKEVNAQIIKSFRKSKI